MTLDRLLTALRAPGTADELRGLDAATAAFVQARAEAATAPTLVAVGGRARRSVAAGVAVAAVLATVSVGAAAAAAYTGNLPRPLQEAAHQVIGAPAPQPTETPGSDGHPTGYVSTPSLPSGSPSGSGPAVTSGAPALFGLCTAFRDRGASAVPTGSVAYRDLVAAAHAAGTDIAGYCAGVLPGGSHRPTAAPSHKPTQRATPRATPRVTPTARPTPSRKPSDVPRATTPAASVPTHDSSGR